MLILFINFAEALTWTVILDFNLHSWQADPLSEGQHAQLDQVFSLITKRLTYYQSFFFG